jgi:hypothetical protein
VTLCVALASAPAQVPSGANFQQARTGGTAPPKSQLLGGLTVQDLTGPLTPADLVDALLGSDPVVSNITYAGVDVASGLFQGGTGIIGFAQGVVLTSGCATNVIGPNMVDDVTCDNNQPGDPDLTPLAGVPTFDRTVLEFDFECPTATAISFQYVLASDEYNEFVNAGFNDAFAFFLNGTNIAIVPGTMSTPVTIDNVNCGNPFMPPGGTNCALYNNNDLQDGGGGIDTEMDGLTDVFTATGMLVPGVNHIKLAIADAGDELFDSAVFLRGESFDCGELTGPVFDPPSPCGQTLFVAANNPLSFDVVALATNGLPGAQVTLTASGAPAGSTFTPNLPVVGQPAITTFDWTPTIADLGLHVITFTATDQLMQTADCVVTVEVGPCPGSASVTTLGAPCGATLASTPPVMGGVATVTIDGNTPMSGGVLFFSHAGAPSFFAQGCEIFLDPLTLNILTFFSTDASGDATLMQPIPLDTSRCGMQFVVQGAIAGASGPLSFGEVTNAILVTFGS